jgi:hypothetical protein
MAGDGPQRNNVATAGQDDISERLRQQVAPSMVRIVSNNMEHGSGFFADAQGDVVTDAHIVAGSQQHWVTTAAGETYKARVVKMDPVNDLAVLRLDNFDSSKQPYLQLSKNAIRYGEPIFSAGYPTLSDKLSLNAGQFQDFSSVQDILTNGGFGQIAQKRYEALPQDQRWWGGEELHRRMIHASAPLEKGDSGGPLLNSQGEVVGVADVVDTRSSNSAYYNPGQYVQQLLEAKPSTARFNFNYEYQAHGLLPSVAHAWQENPLKGAAETGLLAGGGALGGRLMWSHARLGGTGSALLAAGNAYLDFNSFTHAADDRDRWKFGTALLGDAAWLGGSAAMALFPSLRKAGFIVTGLGIGTKLLSSFIPNELTQSDVTDDRGKHTQPYTPNKIFTDGR